MRRIFLITLVAVVATMSLGNKGCKAPADDDDSAGTSSSTSTPAISSEDTDQLVADIAQSFKDQGDKLLTNPATFDQCAEGTVYVAIHDYTMKLGTPIKQAIVDGVEDFQAGGITIDPTPCLGLPGVPDTPDKVDAKLKEYEAKIMPWLERAGMGCDIGKVVAKMAGNELACKILTVLAATISPGSEQVKEILKIVEAPGEPFTTPLFTVKLSGC